MKELYIHERAGIFMKELYIFMKGLYVHERGVYS